MLKIQEAILYSLVKQGLLTTSQAERCFVLLVEMVPETGIYCSFSKFDLHDSQ